MHTLLVLLSLFAHRNDAFFSSMQAWWEQQVQIWSDHLSDTYRFEIDTVIMYEECPNGCSWANTHNDEFILGSGTECTLYVLHGDNPVVTVSGVDDPVWRDTRQSVQLTRFEFPSSFDVSVNYDTLIWTSCEDPVLIDFVRLVAPDGTTQDGYDHHRDFTCMSTDMEAWRHIWWAANQVDWIRRTFKACYQTSLYGKGYNDGEGEMTNLGNYDNYAFWSQREIMGRDDRRELQEQISHLPSTEDVRACELDSTKENAECALMVEQILRFQKDLFQQMKNDPDYQTYLQEREREIIRTQQDNSLEEQDYSLEEQDYSLEEQDYSLEEQNYSLEEQNYSLEEQDNSLGKTSSALRRLLP